MDNKRKRCNKQKGCSRQFFMTIPSYERCILRACLFLLLFQIDANFLLQVHWPCWQMSLHCWLGKFCSDWVAAPLCWFQQLDCSGRHKMLYFVEWYIYMSCYQIQTTFNKHLSRQAEFDFLDSAGSHPIFRWRKIINQTVKIFLCIQSVSFPPEPSLSHGWVNGFASSIATSCWPGLEMISDMGLKYLPSDYQYSLEILLGPNVNNLDLTWAQIQT